MGARFGLFNLCIKCLLLLIRDCCWCRRSSQDKQQSQQEEQEVRGGLQARAGGVGGGAWAGPVGFQAGGVRHNMCDVVLLFHSVKQVSHWALGVDGHILAAVRLSVQRDGSLLHVLIVVWAQTYGWFS